MREHRVLALEKTDHPGRERKGKEKTRAKPEMEYQEEKIEHGGI